jgi:hypothetical protein
VAFTPEDGTGLINANSLCSVADADAYFEERGIAAWTGTDTLKEQALVRATDYMETRWGARFRGVLQFPDTPQALSYPRLYIGFDDVVPEGIKRACAEYAMRALTATLAPDRTPDSSGRLLTTTRTKVGPIETEKVYAAMQAYTFIAYPAADLLVKTFISPGGLLR